MQIPPPPQYNVRLSKRKKDGGFNLTGLQMTQLAESAKQGTGGDSPGKEATWEIDGSLIIWRLTEEELRMAVAYLGQLGRGRVIEVQHVGRD